MAFPAVAKTLERKAQYLLLVAARLATYAVAWAYSRFFPRRRPLGAVRSIAAVWYYPHDMPGSNLRMGAWKQRFETAGYRFDNFWLGSHAQFIRDYEGGNWSIRYRYLRRIVLARLRQFLVLRHYDVVWVDRGFLPYYYTLRYAFMESCLRRIVGRLVLDITDGSDYQANPRLVLDTVAQAHRVTVGFDALEQFYTQRHPDIVKFGWAVPTEPYPQKSDHRFAGLAVVGWMGDRGNMHFVKQLEAQLEAAARLRPFILRVICRRPLPLHIPSAQVEYRDFDRYYETLGTFDVGLCPFLRDDFGTRGKIAMKHQEFMILGIPQVCSPVAISEATVDGENALVATTPEEWTSHLLRLLEDEELRAKLGRNSRATFDRLYTYEVIFPKVLAALTQWEAPDGPCRQ